MNKERPILYSGEIGREQEGMSLRDWFAGEALQGMLVSETNAEIWLANDCAVRCYSFADAMIATRLKK